MSTAALSDKLPQMFTRGLGIRRIIVEKLFGQFTYNLEGKGSDVGDTSKVLLLYGDNGSGKTTIMRMLFFLLSHVDDVGHKTEVGKIRFKKFQVDFSDGTQIIAEREDDKKSRYELRVLRSGRQVAKSDYADEEKQKTKDRNVFSELFRGEKSREQEHLQLLNVLSSLNLGMIYLTDTRELFSTITEITTEITGHLSSRVEELELRFEGGNRTRNLKQAVQQISAWATRQAFKGSTQGEEDVNSVYANIIHRLTSAPQAEPQQLDLAVVIKTLQEQGLRTNDFVRFGLTKQLKVQAIIESLQNMDPSARDMVLGILQPYISGISARLDALEPIRAQLSGFVDTMNSFYKNKSVNLDVNQGMIIESANGDRLSPTMLSSGEGQLLFLLASTIVAKEQSKLFMIDEPEISLNVKTDRHTAVSPFSPAPKPDPDDPRPGKPAPTSEEETRSHAPARDCQGTDSGACPEQSRRVPPAL